MQKLKVVSFGIGVPIPGCRTTNSVVAGSPDFIHCKLYRDVQDGTAVYHIHNTKVNQVVSIPANNVAYYICEDYELMNQSPEAIPQKVVSTGLSPTQEQPKRRGRPPRVATQIEKNDVPF